MSGNSRKTYFNRDSLIAAVSLLGIALFLILRFIFKVNGEFLNQVVYDLPLQFVLAFGGIPLVVILIGKVIHFEFSSDILAGISIITSVILGEYLAGALVVLMLSGGQTLESFAVRRASSVLQALSRRMPSIAHCKINNTTKDILIEEIAIGDHLIVNPHEICPVDGTVIGGHGSMDESYLTGEPYIMSKVMGSQVLSGAINGSSALIIKADKQAKDSRYAKIMKVMHDSEQHRPKIRRLADQLGAYYTPLAIVIAIIAWLISSNPIRFLSVLVIATPCPLLIAIPVAIIGSISLAAKHSIIIKDPAVLEKIEKCRTAMFDKTGTLTYGEPKLIRILPTSGFEEKEILSLIAGLELYSKHPLALAVLKAARGQKIDIPEAIEVSEQPGEGLRGTINGYELLITSRNKLIAQNPAMEKTIPALSGGMECVVVANNKFAALCQFRDEPRADGISFIKHLGKYHHLNRILLISGDNESEVKYLANKVGIKEVYARQTPEQKLELVRKETKNADTIFMGDGINDAPALTAATVGIAFGQGSDITSEAAGAVILESSLQRVDELLHISKRMRSIALQSAIGGIGLSLFGMILASVGLLLPVTGAITQEVIDVLTVVNALRVAIKPKILSDYDSLHFNLIDNTKSKLIL
jgi:heavy metal translocating P-type ATPase